METLDGQREISRRMDIRVRGDDLAGLEESTKPSNKRVF
jgi:hypothetical protein